MSKARKRSQRAVAGDERIRAACQALLADHERITARGVARRASIGAASSITRDSVRRLMLDEFRLEQDRMQEWAARAKKVSTATLEAKLQAAEAKLHERGRITQLLIASHRAMLLAVDEIDGTRGWLRFFEAYKKGMSVDALASIGAIPDGIRLPEVHSRIRR
jgi:hypothetical protein